MDKEADKKHSCNWRREGPITKGRIKVRDALIILITIIILGQALAYLVNITFFLLTLSINVISIFYSGLKLKEKWGAYLSMILLLEFIKISLGWASVNEGLLRAPLLMILGLSSFYTYTLAIYKEVTFKSKNFSLACKSLIIIGLIMYVIDAIRFARITLASVIFLSALLTGSFFIYKSFLKSNKDLGRFSLLGKLLIVPTLTLCLIILLLIL